MDFKFYTQKVATICGRNVAHYLIDSPVGRISVIQYEKAKPHYPELETVLIYNEYGKAEKKFNSICKRIVDGRL